MLACHVFERAVAIVLSREPVKLFPVRIDQRPKSIARGQAYTDAIRRVEIRIVVEVVRVTDFHREVAVVVG